MNYFGYCRVSTTKQECDRQLAALKDYANESQIQFKEIVEEFYTGTTISKRPLYQAMKKKLKKGDCVVVKEVDRLGRNWDEIKDECQWYIQNGINLVIIDTQLLNITHHEKKEVTLEDKLVHNQILEIYCYMVQKEREKISQRTKEALRVKKEQGIVLGRERSEDVVKYEDQVVELLRKGYGNVQIANMLNIDKKIVFNVKQYYVKRGVVFTIDPKKGKSGKTYSDESHVNAVKYYLEQKEINKDISIKEVAEMLGMGYRTLYRDVEKYNKGNLVID